ncbi:ABC transporter ATP-binding protein [uncultured Cohaesibacter sp.]|uniref:ABC transporter ATP-binding protein n=1 Tax=uncultured Cohaesibacter sp. TaxID=1002546 RepID=UPI00292D0171|nr:ABC transporter ATP-binding protein [uncultured Cohaesibacter sp.]
MSEHEQEAELPILEVTNLSKHFSLGNWWKPAIFKAVNDVSFKLHKGEVLSVVGESGSGKSTLARLIARLSNPTEGRILLHGKDILAQEPRKASLAYRRQVQMIFQDPFGSLSPTHPIGYHIERPLQIHKLAQSKDLEREVATLLETVGLHPPADVAERYPFQMSGGQRQRVAIARALAVQPDIILADEPTSMLDVSIRMEVLNLIEKLKTERGIGFLYITHDLASARYVGDRTMVMYAGNVVEEGESCALMENPAHPYTQLLLASVPDPSSGLSTGETTAKAEGTRKPPNRDKGCPFASRCPMRMSICEEKMPRRTSLAANHFVRCHLHEADPPKPA